MATLCIFTIYHVAFRIEKRISLNAVVELLINKNTLCLNMPDTEYIYAKQILSSKNNNKYLRRREFSKMFKIVLYYLALTVLTCAGTGAQLLPPPLSTDPNDVEFYLYPNPE